MGSKKAQLCHYFMFISLIPDLLFSIPSASSMTIDDETDSFGYYQTVRDVTNPVTTIPTIIPAPYGGSTEAAAPPLMTPVIIPASNPGTEVSPQTTAADPVGYPAGSYTVANPPPSLGGSWCIASQGASRAALQFGLDYACGYGRADCSAIQPGGRCYEPNSVRDHASYAFNKYYQKNPIPSSCNFSGTALVTSTDPSSSTCRYPSTSTSSSILNTTNSVGSRVFGAVPAGPTTSSSPSAWLVDYSASLLRSLVIITTLTSLDQLCLS